jgi:hypothetical protein
MDCWSWSLPAGKDGSCPLSYGEICNGCYALIGRYNLNQVQIAQWERFKWTKECLKDKNKKIEWINILINAIKDKSINGYFRVHDSGDLFHPDYILMWYEVCKRLSHIKFWFPTRSYLSKNKVWKDAFKKLCGLKNVYVRPSSINYNDHPPKLKLFADGTTVVLNTQSSIGYLCPKTVNHNSCSDNSCRKCWSKSDHISYLVHGRFGRNIPSKQSQKEINNKTLIKLTIMGK